MFTGNTTTRDNVIRREMRLLEGNVFSTEALKYSVRRLNQLGYFKQLEGNEKDMKVEKTTDRKNAVDVTVKLEEQNRNQLTFGAGVSQFEGVFGQLAFQTANFLGRGESLTVSMTAGNRSQNYQLAFTEPFLFDRNITGGFDIYKRSLQYIGYYTQKSTGGNLMFGFPVADFSRMFINYAVRDGENGRSQRGAHRHVVHRPPGRVLDHLVAGRPVGAYAHARSRCCAATRSSTTRCCSARAAAASISKVVPSFVHNTVDNPIFPNTGRRLTASIDLAMLGGNTQFYKPRVEGILFMRHTSRTSFGLRGQARVHRAGGKDGRSLPIFERLFLGGEYSVRGFDIRSIGPTVPGSLVVLGGNKSLLFNAEYMFSIASQVRLVGFFDAGQVRDFGEPFSWKETDHGVPGAAAAAAAGSVCHVAAARPERRGSGRRCRGTDARVQDVSTGVELRFFMPVLNVPFRLIYSFNPSRDGRAEQPAAAGEANDVPVRGGDHVLGLHNAQCEFRTAARLHCNS